MQEDEWHKKWSEEQDLIIVASDAMQVKFC